MMSPLRLARGSRSYGGHCERLSAGTVGHHRHHAVGMSQPCFCSARADGPALKRRHPVSHDPRHPRALLASSTASVHTTTNAAPAGHACLRERHRRGRGQQFVRRRVESLPLDTTALRTGPYSTVHEYRTQVLGTVGLTWMRAETDRAWRHARPRAAARSLFRFTAAPVALSS